MKFDIKNIKRLASSCLAILLVSTFFACGGDKKTEETAAEKTGTESKNEEAHEEEAPTIATLSEEQIKTVGITYGSVEQKQLTATIKANGNLRVPNNNKANATSLYGGVVKTINIQVGSFVKKGQVVATITNPQFIQLQEEYLNIGNKITYADQEVQRQKELNAGNAGALKNLQIATAELNTLRTRKASLHQQLQLMGINPSGISNGNLKAALVVVSPISGTVSDVFSKIGSYVDVSSPVAEIVDNGQLHLDLNVFEKDLPMLKVGQTIHFTLTNNPTVEYDALVFSIGSAFENESKTIPVHCTVKGNKSGLIDGMNITGFVSINNVTTSAVPNDAIVESEGKTFLFVVTDKKAEEHHEEGEQEHKDEKEPVGNINFEKVEVIRGVSNLGYTAITFVIEIPKGARIVTKGAFFINAKLTNTEGDHH
ncbi:efflux RND transporter periplasmic adaptor subunit [Pedobacter frigiditerrae]|uniref:Efflux RND transporter periplasmic adaptor subunit n=1 Tax=Pedobacter frigiditerrae TaxID=2530452 RepID=A0A4R0MN00_9SPHI|nr:efflux RND transporter periplasmic adaptor subunit [Pedobacter frigiditerrae]TCC87993.1 efflux RND transporter periplasmic adaptor subunit [Pedobacter frigiditerrae]